MWQQRAFASALQQLMTQLGPDWHKDSPARAPLLLALAHLLVAVPASFYSAELPELMPFVVAGLRQLTVQPFASADGLLALLHVLRAALANAQGRAGCHSGPAFGKGPALICCMQLYLRCIRETCVWSLVWDFICAIAHPCPSCSHASHAW